MATQAFPSGALSRHAERRKVLHVMPAEELEAERAALVNTT